MSVIPLSIPAKRLSQSITSSAISFAVNNIKGWDGNDLTSSDLGTQHFVVFINDTRSKFEVMEIDPTTIANDSITISKRGLGFDGTETEVAANKLDWSAGTTLVQFGTDVPQLLNNFVDKARNQTISAKKTFSNVITFNKLPFVVVESSNPTSTSHVITKEAYDASSVVLTGAQSIAGVKTFESIAQYDTAKTFTADQQLVTKKYVDDLAIAGAADADTTTKGIVEEATQSEVNAGTATGGTGAKLFLPVNLIGETGTDKVVKTKSDGFIDESIVPVKVDTQIFTSDGTWTKPANAKLVRVIAIGGGGAGENISGASKGDGGGGAAVSDVLIPAAILGSTESVTIGAGGDNASTADGGDSTFGTFVKATGGVAGLSDNSGGKGVFNGGDGAEGGNPGADATDVGYGAPGGGGGGSRDGDGTKGGDGGNVIAVNRSGGTGGSGSNGGGSNGADGTDAGTDELTPGGGGGGGGGAGSIGSASGGDGGNGGEPGAGAGGAGSNESGSSNGGVGGKGRVGVYTYF